MKKIFTLLTFLTLIKFNSFSQGLTCNQAIPIFCVPGGNGLTIPNAVNTNAPVGPDYGCLSSQPNPKFFYLKNTSPGQLTFQISQFNSNSNPLDADFICWGPFTNYFTMCDSLISSKIHSCSYNPSATETMTINSNSAGQYYVFMITNYANEVGHFSIAQTNGPVTDSTITCPNEVIINQTNPTCSNLSDGSLTISSVLGGVAPYTYSLNGGVFTNNNTFTGLFYGNHYLTIKDANNCSYNRTVTLSAPNPVSPFFGNINQYICPGQSIFLPDSLINGIVGTWSPFPNSTQTTTYTFTPNQGQCAIPDSITIYVHNLTVTGSSRVTDCGDSSGFIRVDSVINGIAPFSYSINGNQFQSDVWFFDLAGGNYNIVALDAIGCSDTISFNIQHVSPLVLDFSSVNIDCTPFQNATVTATATGGSSPYVIDWNESGINSPVFNVTQPGIFNCVLTDSDNCSFLQTKTIDTIAPLQITINSINTHCNQNIGSATVVVTGGTQPYLYMWSNGSFMPTADSLISGQYIVQVYDSSRCNNSAVININPIDGPMISSINQSNISCSNLNNGAISINVSGGQAPYNYFWNTGDTTNSVINLAEGVYDVTIKDAQNCVFASTFEVIRLPEPEIIFSINYPYCGLSNGSVDVQLLNGNPPFTYTWPTIGQTSSTISNLSAGIYPLNVIDGFGCLYTKTAQVYNIGNAITISSNSIIPANCGAQESGAIDINVIGSNGPFTFNWSNGTSQEDVNNLPSGEHQVLVTDNTQCSNIAGFYIPSTIQSLNYVQEICMVTVDSSNLRNLIIWEKNQTQGIKSFRIYRESFNDNYLPIATIPYNTISEYYDSIANSEQRSWRYKITAVDSCDIETPYSLPSKTIHLVQNANANGDFDLTWDFYDGSNYDMFYVWRDDPSTGWVLIDSLPSSVTVYQDQNAPSLDSRYLIEVVLVNPCVSSLKTAVPNNTLTTVVKSKSNIRNNRQAVGIKNNVSFGKNYFSVYPNPTSGLLTVEVNNTEQLANTTTLQIDNLLGQPILRELITKDKTNLDLTLFNKGVYLVRINSGSNYYIRKIIVE